MRVNNRWQDRQWRPPSQAWKAPGRNTTGPKTNVPVNPPCDGNVKSNRWGYADLRLDGPFDFKKIEKKFWRKKSLVEGQNQDKVIPNFEHTVVVSLSVNGQA